MRSSNVRTAAEPFPTLADFAPDLPPKASLEYIRQSTRALVQKSLLDVAGGRAEWGIGMPESEYSREVADEIAAELALGGWVVFVGVSTPSHGSVALFINVPGGKPHPRRDLFAAPASAT